MKKEKIAIVILLATLTLSCMNITGNGILKTEIRSISSFNSIYLADIGNTTIIQGDTESITIEADENIMQYIETTVGNNKLSVQINNPFGTQILPSLPINYTIHIKNFNALQIAASNNVSANNVTSGNLAIEMDGDGILNMNPVIISDKVTINVSGSSHCNITGQAVNEEIHVSSNAEIQLGNLQCSNAVVNLTGSGNIVIWAINQLNATISSSGHISYYGNPVVTKTITGSGQVISLGVK